MSYQHTHHHAPIVLDPLTMLTYPCASTCNPATLAATHSTTAWAESWGLLASPTLYDAFVAARFAELMGRAYPRADRATLALIADWNSWTFLVDTQLDDHFLGREPHTLHLFAQAVEAILTDATPLNILTLPLLGALADIAARLHARVSAAWLQRFRQHVMDTFAMCVREAEYRRRGQLPSEALYAEMRPHTSGALCFFDLIELAEGFELSPALRTHPALTPLVAHTTEMIYLVNDLASLAKERAQGDGNNLILIAQREHNVPLSDALAYVVHRHQVALAAFEQARDHLPFFGADDPLVHRYVHGLLIWLQANLDWSRTTGRYILDGVVEQAVNAHH